MAEIANILLPFIVGMIVGFTLGKFGVCETMIEVILITCAFILGGIFGMILTNFMR